MKKVREIPQKLEKAEGTGFKLLLAANRLFALHGYHAVTVRDIAAEAGIMAGSLYNHYSAKQEMLEIIMNQCEQELRDAYSRMDDISEQAESFEEIINGIYRILKQRNGGFAQYGLWTAMTTQFQFERCSQVFYQVFLQEGRQAIERQLNTAVERRLIPAIDVTGMASFISGSAMSMMSIQAGRNNGYYEEFDLEKWYTDQVKLIFQMVKLARLVQTR